MHWKGLIEWDLVDRRLLGADSAGDPEEIRRAVTLGVDAFLALYSPDGDARVPT
jgi:hypothetical protein